VTKQNAIFQIISKVSTSTFLDGMFSKARGFSSDDMVEYTNMAMDAYTKYDEMNNIPK
jgi:hypothetical protein